MKSRKKKVRQIFSTSTFPMCISGEKKIDINTNSTAYTTVLFNVWSDVTHYTRYASVSFSLFPRCCMYETK